MYAHPRLYELAFSYRDIQSECCFLMEVAAKVLGRPARHVLEVAAGPGVHARTLAATYGIRAHVLDLSEEMLSYAQERAQQEEGVRLECHREDMAEFELPCQVDLACCLLDSIAYLTDHRAFRAHLDCVANALCEGGVYVIEMDHPRGAFGQSQTTLDAWEVQDGGDTLTVEFGRDTDAFDPVTQVCQTTFSMTLEQTDGQRHSWQECAAMKTYLYQEVLALLHGSPFELEQAFGALSIGVPLQGGEGAWRTVMVVRKKNGERE